jgi:hypothetical protein
VARVPRRARARLLWLLPFVVVAPLIAAARDGERPLTEQTSAPRAAAGSREEPAGGDGASTTTAADDGDDAPGGPTSTSRPPTRRTTTSTARAIGTGPRPTTTAMPGTGPSTTTTTARAADPPRCALPSTTGTTIYTGQRDGDCYDSGPGGNQHVPDSTTGPTTWDTSVVVGQDLPRRSCGSYKSPSNGTYGIFRCYPAVWPPPELGYDPCIIDGPFGRVGQVELARSRSATFALPEVGDGGSAAVRLRSDANDCWFFQFEGIRFLGVTFSSRAGVSATIRWGDGTSTPVSIDDPGCSPQPSYAHEYGHRYARGGTYTATVEITSGACIGGRLTDVQTTVLSLDRVVPARLSATGR